MNRRNYLFLFLALVTMGVIFWFSSRDAAQSNAQSDGFITLFLTRFLPDSIAYGSVTLVRKCAHFLIYAVLGGCFYLGFEREGCPGRIPYLAAVSCSLFYAATDELHQVFVPGRAGRLLDICIDGAGALCGAFAALGILMLVRKIKRRKAVGR